MPACAAFRGCLQSHTPAREQLAVLSDGSLRHMATGVFTELYIDVPNAEQSSTASCRSRPRMIPWYMAHRYLTLVNTTLAHAQAQGTGAAAIGLERGRFLLHHRSGSMIGRTCQPSALSPAVIYLAAAPISTQHPPPLFFFSLRTTHPPTILSGSAS